MSIPEYKIVIPSRFGSSRFPGKPLHLLNGKPMILHVIDRALESAASQIVVATDDERIADVCNTALAESAYAEQMTAESVVVNIEMTNPAHESGTDRIAEVATRLDWSESDIIVGLQGDEPATPAKLLDGLAKNLTLFNDADMASYCTAVTSLGDYKNPNRVKVVRDHRDMALYFSRASIPSRRDTIAESSYPTAHVHVGLYAYRCQYLKTFSALKPAYIEQQEQLEQLRVLFQGGRIHVALIDEIAAGVDHPDDVSAIELLLQQLT